MTIKSILKKTWLGKIKKRINRIGYSNKYFASYRKQYNQYSATNITENDERYLRLRILINIHSIEKGLSYNNFRVGFGKNTVRELFFMLFKYIKIQNYDKFVVENGWKVLYKYHIENVNAGFDDSDYLPIDNLPNLLEIDSVGSKTYNIKDILQIVSRSNFSMFSQSRASVRMFEQSGLPIEDKMILNCIKLAQNAPNACNRQSVHVHVLKNKRRFIEIEKLQLGCNGFGRNASAFVFITNNLTLYECSEVKLPIFDAGMFTMNLVYAFLEEGIFSCVLNASFPDSAEEKIREITKIPHNEMINGLLVIYNINPESNIKVPVSTRREVTDICTFVE